MRKNRIKYNGINPQRFELGQLKLYAFLLPLAIVMALPIVFIFMNAFKPLDELFAYPPRFYVKKPTFENFQNLFALSSQTQIPAIRYLFNSLVSTLSVVLLTLMISVSAGYVFSKKRFRLKKLLFDINSLALMFVPVAVSIPRYFIIVRTGLYDNFLAHILPLLATPTGVFLVKQFIDQLPDALVEAAVIDGAGDITILRKIIIPLTTPALSTVAIMTFQTAWNSVESSTMYINDETIKSFSFYMSTLSTTEGIAGQGMAAAASLLMFLPNLILFIILQSRVMSTMTHSGIK